MKRLSATTKKKKNLYIDFSQAFTYLAPSKTKVITAVINKDPEGKSGRISLQTPN